MRSKKKTIKKDKELRKLEKEVQNPELHAADDKRLAKRLREAADAAPPRVPGIMR